MPESLTPALVSNGKDEMPNNYFLGFVLVCIAGLVWSFGSLTLRHSIDLENHLMPFLLYRGLSVFIVIFIFVWYRDGKQVLNNVKRLDRFSILGSLILGLSMVSFVFSITKTTMAISMIMLAIAPLITAVLGFLLLKENLSKTTLFNMFIVVVGVGVMLSNVDDSGSLLGAAVGFFVACCFALFTITLRHNPDIPKLITPGIAGLFCALCSFAYIIFNGISLDLSARNMAMSISSGALVGAGLILYTLGSKYLPAAELILLSLMEVIAGIFWVWLPIMGVNEVPSNDTIIGGLIILSAIVFQGLKSRKAQTLPMP
ncbi:MAG: DMT family transporter [Gammaproteobacteria bacterium]|nr:DMT family transporter [Gammaproteobacteria bacterium]